MGHEIHTGVSPAHRRSQNPVSPSASIFRRSTTFLREETDLSWIAVIKRHRFLLLTLVLLTFLCSIYLYFAITFGADECSGSSGKEEALCRLKRSKTKISHGHRSTRGLLSIQESIEPFSHSQIKPVKQWIAASWTEYLSVNHEIHRVLSLTCKEAELTEDKKLLDKGFSELQSDFLQERLGHPVAVFDLIVCNDCSMPDMALGESDILEFRQLLRLGGYALFLRSLGGFDSPSLHFATTHASSWICLIRAEGVALWQRVK